MLQPRQCVYTCIYIYVLLLSLLLPPSGKPLPITRPYAAAPAQIFVEPLLLLRQLTRDGFHRSLLKAFLLM